MLRLGRARCSVLSAHAHSTSLDGHNRSCERLSGELREAIHNDPDTSGYGESLGRINDYNTCIMLAA